jgi:phenylpyruvate tautomerase PptA (4-oxalocrotonate tautomerase family)
MGNQEGDIMPYFSIETNQTIDQASNRGLIKKTSTFIAELLGKPESYVMIAIKPETPLIFAGGDEPAAFVRLKSIGLSKERCPEFCEKICGFVEQELKVLPNRVFIDFKDLEREMFGWNGKTF